MAIGDKFIILKCVGRTIPVVDDIEDVREELVKDIHEKKLRLAMAEEFDRLKEAAQIDNFLAGTTQSGKVRAVPVSSSSSATRAQPPSGKTALRPVATSPRRR